jgi:Fe-S cluster assembly protein SufD
MPVKTIENTTTKISSTQKLENLLITEFENSKKDLFGNIQLREQAIDSFLRQGIPNRKSEEYKYVNMEQVLKDGFAFTGNKTTIDEPIKHLKFPEGAIIIVVENGAFKSELSELTGLPKGLTICSLAVASHKYAALFESNYATVANIYTDPFAALNTAITKDGVFIHVAKNTVIETPVHIVHISSTNSNTIIHPRNLIIAEANAQVKIIESYKTVESTAKTFNNALTEIIIDQNAIVDHYKIQEENEWGYLMNTTQALQKQQSVFSTHTFIFDGSLVRNNLNIILDGEGIETHLNGLYLTKGNQVVDNHTLVDHRKPNCNSNELYKGIVEDKSSATFNGKIYVRKDAQKTNAFQSNKNILLSDDGTVNTKPQLEIYADDVKCSHGTSTGKLDEEKIFYLRARGLSETSAKKLLMHAFASEVTDTVKIDSLKEYLESKISERFE